MMFILEAILTICVFVGACIVGIIMGLIGLYIYTIVKNNREAKERNNRYYK